jgi:hypothetical protein
MTDPVEIVREALTVNWPDAEPGWGSLASQARRDAALEALAALEQERDALAEDARQYQDRLQRLIDGHPQPTESEER